jgi:putative flippase GtrA
MIRKARNLPRLGDMTVFSDRQAKNGAMMRLARELIPYFGASAVGLALDVSLLWLQVSVIGVSRLSLHYLVAKGGAAGCTFLANFAMRRWLLFTQWGRVHATQPADHD